MLKIVAGSKWKPVKFPVSLQGEGLIGIEELTVRESQMITHRKITTKQRKKKQKKLRSKNVFVVTEDNATISEEKEVAPEALLPWTNLHVPDILSKALIEQGFHEPTEIQRLCLPSAIAGRRDILGAAPTGSGKTLAFALPLLFGVLKQKLLELSPPLLGLIITPTRELALQVRDLVRTVAAHTGIRVEAVVGGMSEAKQSRLLLKSPEIVVGTPGRLWELCRTEPHLSQIDQVPFLVIDETDRMLEKGHFPELRALLERLNSNPELSKRRQNFIFSATLTFVHEPPRRKQKRLTPGEKLQNLIQAVGAQNPKVVDLTTPDGTAPKLNEFKILTSEKNKDIYLFAFLKMSSGRRLIFLNSIGAVRRLMGILSELGIGARMLHSGMEQKQRLKNLEKFRNEMDQVLLATDVAARGLDIPDVEHVIHYHVPRTTESYIHRSGRTARAFKEGSSLLFIDPSEVQLFVKISTALGKEVNVPSLDIEDSLFKWATERVECARGLDGFQTKQRKLTASYRWAEKTAEEMDLLLDEEIIKNKPVPVEAAKCTKQIQREKDRLKKLLLEPPPISGKLSMNDMKISKVNVKLIKRRKLE